MNKVEAINRAVSELRSGKVILCPTDSVWGLSCDALDKNAIGRISEIKQRLAGKSYILLVSSVKMLAQYVEHLPKEVLDYYQKEARPTTFVFLNPRGMPSTALAPDGSIAIRLLKSCFCREIVHQFGRPIVSTSANLSGEAPANSLSEIAEDVKQSVDWIFPINDEPVDERPSKIVKIEADGHWTVIRE